MKKPKVKKVKDRGTQRYVVEHNWFTSPKIRFSFVLEANADRYAEACEADDRIAMLRLAWGRNFRRKVELELIVVVEEDDDGKTDS